MTLFTPEDVESVQSRIGAMASVRSQRAWLTKDDIAALLEAALPEPMKRLIEDIMGDINNDADYWAKVDHSALKLRQALIASRAKEAGK